MEIVRNRRGLLKRIKGILKTANELQFVLEWQRFGNDYQMSITDNSNNYQMTKEIKGFKNSTKSLHSGFDYFEEILEEKRNLCVEL